MNMQKIKYSLVPMLLLATVLFINSDLFAATQPIKVVKFTEYAEMEKGKSATISWEFENTSYVNISGINKNFSAFDSVKLNPEKTEFYTITAFQGKKDSLKLNFIINVIPKKEETNQIASETPSPEPTESVRRGPADYKRKKLTASLEKMGYLNGFAKATPLTQPKQLKIMRTINLPEDKEYLIRALALDDFGNYLTGLGSQSEINWTIGRNAGTIKDNKTIDDFDEQPFTDSIHLEIGIALDNSAAASQQTEIISQIKEFIQYLAPEDNLFFSTFNQNYLQMFALSPPDKALWEFDNMTLNKPEGLNAIHKAAFKTLEKLGEGFYEDRICVLITFNSDDASIIYTANDVATIAQETESPIYVIGIGNAVDSYTLRFISEASGGKFYHLLDNEIDQLKNILVEIALSNKGYYEFTVPVNDITQSDDVLVTLGLRTKKTDVNTRANLVLKPKLQPVKYQVVANFDYKESYIKSEYENMLNSLAYILKNNPGYKIQLIGHTGNEGSDKDCFDLSVQRAENVKAYLMSQEIPEHQVKTTGWGNHKPLYYLQQSDWQQAYNRRVEIKWLDPELKPYEIGTDIYESQAEAEKALKDWDDKGYKAYFDRIIYDNKAMYEVKIWGYGTLEQAEKAAAKINAKLGKKVQVE
ncbi:hypothetical protein D9V86_07735 [Bacteroidetes/Chlorobi group bacterium ChocPot_Mid]|nr:MAG: hypothetical protein D9V86_07735 [Bacteroidetes/Chlorobi group bacterium ChocPot_Mid]